MIFFLSLINDLRLYVYNEKINIAGLLMKNSAAVKG